MRSATPRVRVVVVNHNGGDLTLACLDSLAATDWPSEAFEIVLVDNPSGEAGGRDGVPARVKARLPRVSVIEAGSNGGFGAGCNLGMGDLTDIDYIALVNNDATVEPGWLAPLVGALEADPGAGAACPRILFSDRFVDLYIECPTTVRGRGDRRNLGVAVTAARLDGLDAFGRLQLVDGFWGPEPDRDRRGSFQWTSGRAHLRIPARADGSLPACELRLEADSPRSVVVTSGGRSRSLDVSVVPGWYEVDLDGEAFDVINNVGCSLVDSGFGADRGYQQPDRGQFATPEEVFGWCGAAVLLSRSYLETVGRFEERYFLYYEDFDLSWRGRGAGWRYLYVPASVVRHVHSASSVEGSALVDHFVERNRLLTLTRNGPAKLAAKAVCRQLMVTASYARRDILSPLAHRRRPNPETVRRRLRSLGAYLRVLPNALSSRRRLRYGRRVGDAEILSWMKAAAPALER